MSERAYVPFKTAKSSKGRTTPASVRVSPADRTRARIDELFAPDRESPESLEDVARLGAQLLRQAALEAEVTGFPGRDRYQRAAACDDAGPGYRNGYRDVTVKTTAGAGDRGPAEAARYWRATTCSASTPNGGYACSPRR